MVHRSSVVAFLALLAACSGTSSSGSDTKTTVTVSPATATLKAHEVLSIEATQSTSSGTGTTATAETSNDGSLFDWTITEGAAGGTLALEIGSVDFGYTPPSAAGVYHVVATSKKDHTASATCTITFAP